MTAWEQADYRSLVISLNACFVLNLAVLPPKMLKKSSQLLLTTHRGLSLTSHSTLLLSQKMLFVKEGTFHWGWKYVSVIHQGQVCS